MDWTTIAACVVAGILGVLLSRWQREREERRIARQEWLEWKNLRDQQPWSEYLIGDEAGSVYRYPSGSQIVLRGEAPERRIFSVQEPPEAP